MHSFPEAQDCHLMGHHNKQMDVESLRRSGRRRGRCLDACLVLSVMVLFVAVTAGAAGGVMVVMELRSKLERPSFVMEASKLSGDVPEHTYKMQNFVYLEAASSELRTSTMRWAPVLFAAHSSVGSNYVFDAEQHSLKAERAGTYFMYIDLNLTCTYRCSAGLLSVRVSDQLTCEVQLPEVTDSTPVSRKCWTVSRLEGHKLLTQMTVPKEGLENWRLELSGSGFGMFLVD
ncbi:uncharacterized protein LOC130189488 [Pseudoliparis swirei]|uniref:uncharacterized protein LOC130189488 n=1 Tax=Pseudoliparis swirei TaxID=2059687 RepID=UPI0024BE7793|nr:uncharacterized protein LOC130189488 [Pseudoliparis swirei]